jgi:hypothetical protein
MTIWHLGLNKSPVVSPGMLYNAYLAGGWGKNGNQKGRGGFFLFHLTSTFTWLNVACIKEGPPNSNHSSSSFYNQL